MEKDRRREEERYEAVHLLHYICLDSGGRQVGQGMARTLNISEAGVKVETHEPIETRYILFLAIGIKEDIFDIKGKVIYCNRGENSRFESGIEFYEVDFDLYAKLRRFINEFKKNEGKDQ